MCQVEEGGEDENNDHHAKPQGEEGVGEEEEPSVIQTTSGFIRDDDQRVTTVSKGDGSGDSKVVVRRSNQLVPDYKTSVLALAFPSLFPFGTGDPSFPRPIKISLEECVRYYLMLSTRRFAQHHSFVLVAFDMVVRTRAVNNIWLRCKLYPHMAERAYSVTKEELAEMLKHREEVQNSIYSSSQIPPPPNNPNTSALFSGLWAGTSKMWGTNEERKVYRRHAFSLAAELGQPSLFITINPNDAGSIAVCYYAGIMSKQSLDEVNKGDLPTLTQRMQVVALDPVACAMNFQRLMDGFVSVLLGFDTVASTSRPEGGIFGHCSGFFGCVETQGRGSLHLHLLVWLHGAPMTSQAFRERCDNADSQFLEMLVQYVGSVTRADYPSCPSTPTCHKCGMEVVSREIDPSFGKKGKQPSAPLVAECTGCSMKWKSMEWIAEAMERESKMSGLTMLDDDDLSWMLANPNPLECPSFHDKGTPEHARCAAAMTQVLTKIQTHSWCHTASCFKSAVHVKDGQCRFCFPRNLSSETRMNENGAIDPRREIGCEYLNPYNELLTCCMKCNTDIRVLLGKEGPRIMWYALKYATKLQQEVESKSAVAIAAFARRQEIENEHPDVGGDVMGRRRMMSLVWILTSKQEIPAQLAALYLLRKSAEYSSHKFEPCILSQFIAVLNGEACEAVLAPTEEGNYTPVTQFQDYCCRPHSLDDVSLWEFVKSYEKVKRKGNDDEEQIPECERFLGAHPQESTHIVVKRRSRRIVEVLGPRLPDEDVFENEDGQEKRELFSQMLLTLFKPFRSKGELLGSSSCWHDAFLRFEQFMSPEGCIYRRNMRDYYIAKREDAAEQKKRREAGENQPQEEELGEDEFMDDGLFEKDSEHVMDVDIAIQQLEEQVINGMSSSELDAIKQLKSLCSVSSSSLNELPVGLEVKSIQKAIDDLRSGMRDELKVASERLSYHTKYPDCDTIVEALDKATTDCAHDVSALDSQSLPRPPPVFSTLREISRLYTLNELQHRAFVHSGTALLDTLKSKLEPGRGTPKQLLMYLGGEAGTGKTRVISAIRALAASWQFSRAVRAVAPTGIAASLIGGGTLHSFLGTCPHKKTTTVSPKLIDEFQSIEFLVLDEVSMVSKRQLAQDSRRLQELKQNSNQPFGGLHLILSGDFYQLPPVRDSPLYVAPKVGDGEEVIAGYELWRKFQTVVILRENMRQRLDPSFHSTLEAVRSGRWDDELIHKLNSRVRSLSEVVDKFTPIVVQTNKERMRFNGTMIQECARYLSRENSPIRIPAIFTVPKGSLSDSIKRKLFGLSDDRLQRLPPFLDVFTGMPVMVTQNICVPFGVANGTLGIVWGVDTTSFSRRLKGKNMEYRLPGGMPKVVFVKILGKEPNQINPILPELPGDVFPVLPFDISTKVRFCPKDPPMTVSMKQFPLVPAFSLTAYKVQGLSLDGIVVGSMRIQGYVPPAMSFYVMLSRAKTIQNLFLLEPLDIATMKHYTPSPLLLQEVKRLESLERGSNKEEPPPSLGKSGCEQSETKEQQYLDSLNSALTNINDQLRHVDPNDHPRLEILGEERMKLMTFISVIKGIMELGYPVSITSLSPSPRVNRSKPPMMRVVDCLNHHSSLEFERYFESLGVSINNSYHQNRQLPNSCAYIASFIVAMCWEGIQKGVSLWRMDFGRALQKDVVRWGNEILGIQGEDGIFLDANQIITYTNALTRSTLPGHLFSVPNVMFLDVAQLRLLQHLHRGEAMTEPLILVVNTNTSNLQGFHFFVVIFCQE